jgi:sporulation protein YlmC with PRC-barrel domain
MLASDLLGCTVHDLDGRRLGRVTDLIARQDDDGHTRVTGVLVSRRLRARLFGYERPGLQNPWILEKLVRLLHGHTAEVPLEKIRWPPGATASDGPG